MAYEPTVWKNGDLVTAKKLNKMEQGIVNNCGTMVLHIDNETGALDKTWQEIYDAVASGTVCTIPIDVALGSNPHMELHRVCSAYKGPLTLGGPNKFIASTVIEIINNNSGDVITESRTFVADSADDYPAIITQ